MPQDSQTLILFTRFPDPGTTKTRLIPALGPDGAADLHRRLTERVLRQAEEFCRHTEVALEIHFHGGSVEAMRQWLGPHHFVRQRDGSLGERMEHAFGQIFSSGVRRVVLIGSDCPELTGDILDRAFAVLGNTSLVLGPAQDGGYYLIGLDAPRPFLFRNIAWGTPTVLLQTLAQAHALAVHQLPLLHDIDRPEDLVHLDHYSHSE